MNTSAEANASSSDRPPPPAAPALYGGFWVRVGAYLVDSLIIWLAWGSLFLVTYLVQGKSSEALDILQSMIMATLGIIYHGYFVSSERMATPGKRLFGLYVTDVQDRRLGFPHAVGRYLASFVSALLLGIGYLMVAFYPRKQALHDVMANTLVHRRPGTSTGGMIFVSAFVFVLVFGAGLWYAVGKSLLFDYGARTGMEDLYKVMSENKVPVQDYARKNQAWPTTWEQIESVDGKNPMKSIDSMTQVFVKDIHLEEFGAMVAVIDFGDRSGKLRLAPQRIGNNLGWNCYVSADIVRYTPEACGVEK
jgi:uncharacterized RDD family membrane protein YckC